MLKELQSLRSEAGKAEALLIENIALRNELRKLRLEVPAPAVDEDKEVMEMVKSRDCRVVITVPGWAVCEPEHVAEQQGEFRNYHIPHRKKRRHRREHKGLLAMLSIVEITVNWFYHWGWIGLETAIAFGMVVFLWAGLYAI